MQRRIPEEIARRMAGRSFHPGCPVPLGSLSLVDVRFVTLSSALPREGRLVVHADVAAEVAEIFEELFEARFPLERVELIDDYDGDDDRSMAANNSSAFNCRRVAAAPEVWSKHAFGLAIDINPIQNPYARPRPARIVDGVALGEDGAPVRVEPPAGAAFVDRAIARPGMVIEGDACHAAFVRRGWVWGGAWQGRVDYQHFEKP